MPQALWLKIAAIRIVVVFVVVGFAYGLIATIDMVFGTSIVFVIWQWLGRAWLYVGKWVNYLSRFGLRWLPNLFRRFVFRKGLSGVSKLVTTGALALMFVVLGGHRYHAVVRWANQSKSTLATTATTVWQAEIWFLPRWLRAGIFVVATIAMIVAFAEIQEWAENRDAPTFYGIDPWSFSFGVAASFFLTRLPLIGFDHFLRHVFKPVQHHVRGFVRRRGPGYTVLNWLIAFRPARRWAELQRKRFMRRWHADERMRASETVSSRPAGTGTSYRPSSNGQARPAG